MISKTEDQSRQKAKMARMPSKTRRKKSPKRRNQRRLTSPPKRTMKEQERC